MAGNRRGEGQTALVTGASSGSGVHGGPEQERERANGESREQKEAVWRELMAAE